MDDRFFKLLRRCAAVAIAITVLLIILSGCCRPATVYQVQKWERNHKFEKPLRGAWGLHLFRKKNTYKY